MKMVHNIILIILKAAMNWLALASCLKYIKLNSELVFIGSAFCASDPGSSRIKKSSTLQTSFENLR